MILPIRGELVYERWIAFAERLSAECRWIYAGFVLTVVALVAYYQGWSLISVVAWVVSFFLLVYAWVAAAWPDDPGTASKHTRRWRR